MAVPPATPVSTISPAEMQILVSRAGLVLNPGQVADLVLAWRQVAVLIAAMPRNRPLADDMALRFRLSPPVAAVPEPVVRVAGPVAKAAKAVPRPAPKAKVAARPKTPARTTPKR